MSNPPLRRKRMRGVRLATASFLIAGLIPLALLFWISMNRYAEDEANQIASLQSDADAQAKRLREDWREQLESMVRKESARSFTEFQYWHAPPNLEGEGPSVLLSPLVSANDQLAKDYLEIRLTPSGAGTPAVEVRSPRIPSEDYEREYSLNAQYANEVNQIPQLSSALDQVVQSWSALAPELNPMLAEASKSQAALFTQLSPRWKPDQSAHQLARALKGALNVRSADKELVTESLQAMNAMSNAESQRVASKARSQRGGAMLEAERDLPASETEAKREHSALPGRASNPSGEALPVQVFPYRFWISQQAPLARSFMWRSVVEGEGDSASVRLQFIWLDLESLHNDWLRPRARALPDQLGLQVSESFEMDDQSPVLPDLRSGASKPLIAGGMPLPLLSIQPHFAAIRSSFDAKRSESIALSSAYGLLLLVLGAMLARTVSRRARLSEEQSAFVSAVSHEMRTPLAAIRLQAEMLNTPALANQPERITKSANHIVREQERLMHTISMILESSRVEQGAWQPRLEMQALQPVIQQAVDSARASHAELLAPSGGQALRLEWSDQLDPAITRAFDGAALSGLLANLIDNAFKYASPSQAKPLRVQVMPAGDAIELRVVDSGPGLSRAEKRRACDRFYRASAHRNAAGTGLGLWVSHAYARAHGWTLRLEDTAGGGLTLTLRIP